MRDTLRDPKQVLEYFEPGSEAYEFVRACTVAAGNLMQLLQGQSWTPDSLAERIDHLEKRLDVLQDTLENTIRTTGSLLESLGRLESRSDD